MHFSLKYQLQTDSVRLFTEHSPHKRMRFTAPWLHIHINISLISTCLIQHLRTDVDAALQKLAVFSKQRRSKFVKEFTEVLTEIMRMLYNIWFMDECHFWMNGHVNKQTMCLWCDENPYKIEKAQLHPEKFTV